MRYLIAILLGFYCSQVLMGEETDTGNNLAAEAKAILLANCAECHAGDNAKGGVDVLNHQDLLDSEHLVPRQPDESQLYQLVTSTDEDVMPPSSRPSLTADQIRTLRKWIRAGADKFPAEAKDASAADAGAGEPTTEPMAEAAKPETEPAKPTPVAESTKLQFSSDESPSKETAPSKTTSQQPSTPAVQDVLTVILNHVRQAPDSQRRFLRFFSVRHLYNAGLDVEQIQSHRWALAKAINHLSKESPLVVPQPIDAVAGGTVFAIDIRKLGWHRKAMTAKNDLDQALDFFDLVLLEYPYAVIPEDSSTFDKLRREFLAEAEQVRPIPYVHADWFCSTALQPPLYHDLLQLPRTLAKLESLLGVDVNSNLETSVMRRGGMTVSGVSRNNRVVERHPHRDGYYWKSHDFRKNTGVENILVDPLNFEPAGGEMIFRLPNGMQGYYVSDDRGDRLDFAPTEIVVDKFASDRIVRNGLGCIRCHGKGIKDFNDVIRKVVSQLPGSPGFDKRKTLEIYPTTDEWQQTVKADQTGFLNAIASMQIGKSRREPLSVVTAAYLEDAIDCDQAAAELGVPSTQLATLCRAPGFTGLGLAPLAADSVIRRDAFEHNFDRVIRSLGLGVPLIPIDAHSRRNYLPIGLGKQIEFKTNKRNNFFEPGDRLRVSVTNRSGTTVHIELYGTSIAGEKVSLTNPVQELTAGETFNFPATGEDGLEVRGGLGEETITLFASSEPFKPAHIFSGDNIDDRLVHAVDQTLSQPSAETMLRKVIAIETR